ncbi:MAG: hypothetical protein A2268_06685 [Candidatus Raymondbacteria bacterium RifOxyA12_full_50_37]|uniref:Lipoprotein n=1 Tax=Candidatus Raymondbacteria bacterium RIFOXYD12_FULL_49_13 TaxID=1817890 RepID=A0A1F7F011_UNCRA|nr:MAG: hypothetical protein A2350_00650 [Candidatus Raymondbacteria bacterium RifOxyB12_full_50_8]OGJ87209.1 MAG: hypothetical protein A2268_06685 [Candidatus Raymondbacteria bacterium RifOxyA12_full_50_37]OGJ88780.1 MAG: hypothetical protein A2248_08265 [Candidatus Raymondbacteria bacterium RIFOXYA2_FULL_49_16]OGJ96539.1 MAG: hypothetical protein A2453_03230 [Candidatus Raymondbacteria bacterium RIFOXYC2_FULL_50_21]OGJ99172.1 MAG: hypothetical protein A2487_10365 [Candidatus Raymondbacteria b
MKKFLVLSVVALLFAGFAGGCSQKLTQEEKTQLEEAKTAAEDAQKKLHEMRQEKAKLEAEKQGK